MNQPVPELLCPAGTLNNMRYALAYGADAVYAGQPRYSLRVRNNDFQLDHLAAGIAETHGLGKRFYVASNLLPHNAKVDTYLADMEPVVALGPDALIMADPGLILLVRERWPGMPVHLSVQANTMNYAAVRFWQSMGLKRIILSRELSLDEIEDIRQRCPDMELEVFVHGALCVAYSGRCLLSGYFNHRDPNQGTCTNSCRWRYRVHDSVEDETGGAVARHPLAERAYLLEESERPGEFMPVFEDEHGTYMFNSKDLRAVQHVERLVRIGIDSLKIEGRTKSHYYVARTAQTYRRAVDDAAAGRAFDPSLLEELESLANRGYTEGFYRRHAEAEPQNYRQSRSESSRQRFVGEITGYDAERGFAEVLVKNKLCRGDALELILPGGNRTLRLEYMESADGEAIEEAPGGGYRVRIPVPLREVKMGLIAKWI